MLGIDPSKLKLPKLSPDELLGITFLRDTVVSKTKDKDAENHENLKFVCVLPVGDSNFDEILTYQELSNIIEESRS
jgi:hypothetical protein